MCVRRSADKHRALPRNTFLRTSNLITVQAVFTVIFLIK